MLYVEENEHCTLKTPFQWLHIVYDGEAVPRKADGTMKGAINRTILKENIPEMKWP